MDRLAQAIDGFGELAETLHAARGGAVTTTDALRQPVRAYVGR